MKKKKDMHDKSHTLTSDFSYRWSVIAAQLPGRTDNDIKKYWNTKLKKKLLGRREQGNARGCPGMNIGAADGLQDDSSYQSELSESALEGLQLHMKLQSPQNSLSNFNDNPALWPELLHPLLRAEKMIQSIQLQPQQTLGQNLNLHAPGLECCDSTTGSRIENEVDVGYYLPAMTSTGADLQHDSPKVLPRNVESGMYSDTAYDGSRSLAFGPVISISPCSSDSIPMNYRGNITGSNTDKLLDVQNNTAELEKTVISRAGGIMPQDEQPSDGLDYFEASSGSKDSMVWWSGDIQIESGFGQSTPWHTTSLIHHQGVF